MAARLNTKDSCLTKAGHTKRPFASFAQCCLVSGSTVVDELMQGLKQSHMTLEEYFKFKHSFLVAISKGVGHKKHDVNYL